MADERFAGGIREPGLRVSIDISDTDPEAVKKGLQAALMGAEADPERAKKIEEIRPKITEWLSQPENLERFGQDPVGTLAEQFPGLELAPAVAAQGVPERFRVHVFSLDVDPTAIEIFQHLWQHVAGSEADADAFRASPLGALATVGAGYPPDKVARVQEAFEAVLGIHHLSVVAPDIAQFMQQAVAQMRGR
jgi:hypothetical protein